MEKYEDEVLGRTGISRDVTRSVTIVGHVDEIILSSTLPFTVTPLLNHSTRPGLFSTCYTIIHWTIKPRTTITNYYSDAHLIQI